MRATNTFAVILLSLQFSIYAQIATGSNPLKNNHRTLLDQSTFIEDPNLVEEGNYQIFPLNIYTNPDEIARESIKYSDARLKNNTDELFSLYSTTPGETGFGNLLISDCNRNGENELVYEQNGKLNFFEISEMGYRVVHSLNGYYNPIAIGYIDNDDRVDLVVQEGNMVKVFEGTSASAFPTQLVWAHTLDGPYGQGNVQQYGSITDVDRDGRKEITMTSNQLTFLDYGAISVFECRSNNNYERTIYVNLNYEGSALGSLAIGDINNNRTIEIAAAAGIGDTLYVFECNNNNSLINKFKISTGLMNQYSVILAKDLDGDRIPEVCVSGDSFNPSGMRSIQVYELGINDLHYITPSLITQFTELNGIQPISTGNILSLGRDELVLQSSGRTYIFNASSNNNFSLTETLEEDGGSFAHCFNVKSGLANDELLVLWPGKVYIYTSSDDLNNIDKISVPLTSLANYPNPFNPSTTIKYSVPQSGFVKLSVYNIVGEEVSMLLNETVDAGFYEVTFNASNLPSGTYFYNLQTGNFVETKKMILLK